MKHIFIMNPVAGSKDRREEILGRIGSAAEEAGVDYEIYFTKHQGDCRRYVREICAEYAEKGIKLRIYGCGGDGTVHETVNGVIGFDNVEIGIIPMGTGNDYIRNYGSISDFMDIKRQLAGSSVPSDAILYKGEHNDTITEGYCANMFNIGFDCNVVDLTARVKKWPFVSGSLAYLVSVFLMLIKKKGADIRIEYSNGHVKEGRILLAAVANGCYCGGGIKGVPYCDLNDGLMDVSVINDVSRNFFVRLFPSYIKGTHPENKAMKKKKVLKYTKEKTLTIIANGESLRLCTDGEITTQKRIEFSAVKDAFRFIVPQDCSNAGSF